MLNRDESFREMAERPLDVLVIGGGIVGAGVARDAALRGLRTALVEQRDFAYGTSGRSSRLLHGGLRYLAQGRLKLVYEASHEKRVISVIAPHLTGPLPFLFPTYMGTSWPRWQLAVGVKLYDLLCGGQNFGHSERLSVSEMKLRLLGLRSDGLTGGVRYFDALTNDARLVVDTLRSAVRGGAIALNYTRYVDSQRDGRLWQCELADGVGDRTLAVSARVVVNASGAWSPLLPHSAVRLRLTKGVHLVVDRRRLPVPEAVVMADGSRILFAIPWGERVILGTTDTDYSGSPEAVKTEAEDLRYVLDVTNREFPQAGLSQADVISAWAGLRPLLESKVGDPSDISRAHLIKSPRPGWIDVVGGKLTTYRLIGEQTIDLALGRLDRARRPSPTATEPLLPSGEIAQSGIVPPALSREVVAHYCRNEWAVHLDDVMRRRSSWAYYHADAGAMATTVADWMAAELGWDDARREAELVEFRAT